MKKTLIALALIAVAGPVLAGTESHAMRFDYNHAAVCGIETSTSGSGKLIVDNLQKPNPSGAHVFTLVDNTKDQNTPVTARFKITNGPLPSGLTEPRYSTYIAKYADFENSAAVATNDGANSSTSALKKPLNWNTPYHAQLKIENWSQNDLKKIKGNTNVNATLTISVTCN